MTVRVDEIYQLRQELARLSADYSELREAHDKKANEIERLRAALKPFQRNVEASSLSAALGHIDREALWKARHAYEQ